MNEDTLTGITLAIVWLIIGVAFVGTFVFSVIGVMARRWKLGFLILAVIMLVQALPPIIMAFVLEGATPSAVASMIAKAWITSLITPLLFFVPLALLLRWFWDDSGHLLNEVIDRHGRRGAIIAVAAFFVVLVVLVYVQRWMG